ncbi:hypothetical protein [Segnochrobactrum spirostomi]|uniref:Uncharacterized protein n=1 Tax=Segnochrobactrum spirostomi TaxID=2608987 RepID=A0A6A7Y7K0_9HYPH|nr:hypothetical protein [Segnochrobactrum spirostomi]MQT14806.1 hypothetical protein [Segnochrobactrum spirostomi]
MSTQPKIELDEEEISKDAFFRRIAEISEEMIARHGKDFAMGALVLAAQWIAENRTGTVKGAASRRS